MVAARKSGSWGYNGFGKGRVCALCGKPGGTAFLGLLREWGITDNSYAHAYCVEVRREKEKAKQCCTRSS